MADHTQALGAMASRLTLPDEPRQRMTDMAVLATFAGLLGTQDSEHARAALVLVWPALAEVVDRHGPHGPAPGVEPGAAIEDWLRGIDPIELEQVWLSDSYGEPKGRKVIEWLRQRAQGDDALWPKQTPTD